MLSILSVTFAVARVRRLIARAGRVSACALALSVSGGGAVVAQSPSTGADTLAEGRRLRDAGDFAIAAALLAAYAEGHPEDAGAARLAAQTLYWAQDFPRARAVYEMALARHPNDVELRLEYGRMLVETGEELRAREVIEPVLGVPEGAGRGYALLGTASYWRGDFTAARRFFAAALRADSTQSEARRQLDEIELASASWTRAGVVFRHDDQPLGQVTTDVEAGWFATPLTPFTLRGRLLRGTDVPQAPAHGATVLGPETVTLVDGGFSHSFPAARTTFALGGGFARHGGDATTQWTGRASLGVRFPAGFTARGHWRREPYLYTVTSLATAVMTQNAGVALDWNDERRGWLGAAAVEREQYPDDNAVVTAYAWALAPLVRRGGGAVRVGYRFAAQDATENRFVPAEPDRPVPPGQGARQIEGRYVPYFTPSALAVHSLLASAELRPGPRATITAGGDYGVNARDDAPVLVATPAPGVPNGVVERTFYRRRFTPWSVRGGLDLGLTRALRLGLSGEHSRGAYYEATTGSVHLTYSFVDLALRRARSP